MALHITPLPGRAVLELAGPDAITFLQGLVTNDVTQVSAERPVWAALLSPQGKYLFDFVIFNGGQDSLLLDTEAERLELLTRRLAMYRLRAKVDIVPRPDLRVYAAWGDAGTPDGALPDPRLENLGWRWITQLLINPTATPDEYDLHRLHLGVPDGSKDIAVDKMLWLEANAAELNGVDFRKGCYVGQENTARMFHRSKVRKRLLPVTFGFEPETGLIMADGKEAGELRSCRNGRGLAFLRMEFVENGASLSLDGKPLTVQLPDFLREALPLS